MRNLKRLPRPKQRRHHRMLRMRMNAAPPIAQVKRVPEQRRARGLLQAVRGPTQEDAAVIREGVTGFRLGVRQDEDVGGFDAFFLDAGGGDEYDVSGYERWEVGDLFFFERVEQRTLCECRSRHQFLLPIRACIDKLISLNRCHRRPSVHDRKTDRAQESG